MPNLSEISKDLSATVPVYWKDSYRRTFQSKILRSIPDEKKHAYLVLDETIFHPKGGGQPSDKGTIQGSTVQLQVKKVMASGPVIVHWGKLLAGQTGTSESVTGTIDWDWRFLMMRRHSSAHLLDYCLAQVVGREVDASDSWLGDIPYVAYKGEPPSLTELRDAERLENWLIGEARPVRTELVPVGEARRRFEGRSSVLEGLPGLETVRLVTVEGCGPIGCGGTHLSRMDEAKGIRLDRVEAQPDGFRVYFDVV